MKKLSIGSAPLCCLHCQRDALATTLALHRLTTRYHCPRISAIFLALRRRHRHYLKTKWLWMGRPPKVETSQFLNVFDLYVSSFQTCWCILLNLNICLIFIIFITCLGNSHPSLVAEKREPLFSLYIYILSPWLAGFMCWVPDNRSQTTSSNSTFSEMDRNGGFTFMKKTTQ